MPEIMRQFGQTIIVALGAVMLMVLLFVMWPSDSGSALDDIGARAGVQIAEREGTGVSSAVFDAHLGRSVPKVVTNGSAPSGVELSLYDSFTITDSDGAVWDNSTGGFVRDGVALGGLVQIESIVSSDGTEHVGGLAGDYATDKVELSQATGSVKFLEPGVYYVRVRVLDHDNVEASYTIPLIVDFALTE